MVDGECVGEAGETVTVGRGVLVTIVVFVGLGLTLPFVTLQADNKTSRNTAHRRYVITFFIFYSSAIVLAGVLFVTLFQIMLIFLKNNIKFKLK